jgi:two-component system, NtrC family, sensor kinase
MNDDIGREEISADSHRIPSRWHGIPIAVFLMGVLSIAMLMWMKEINKGQRENSGLADVIMDIQIKTALAHLWLEEALSEDVDEDIVKARSNLADAVKLSETILYGGKTEYYLIVRPLRSPDFLQRAEKAAVLLSQFKAIAEIRFSQSKLAGIGSDLDEHFDQVFVELHGTVKELEDIVEIKEARDYARSVQLFYAISIVWSLIVAAGTAGVWHHESRRKRAEDALQNANDELETRVDLRTRELRLVNDQLSLELAERRQAEEALRESEKSFKTLSEQFHALLDSIADPLFLLSPDLKVLWANRGAAMSLGKEISALEGELCHVVWRGACGLCSDCPAARCFATQCEQAATFETPDGRQWELRTFPVKDETGSVRNVLVIAIDITEKTLLQKEAERSARLASLGELAAGVAHEINNPVSGIISCAEILVNMSSEESREHDIGRRITREGNRIAYIVKSLLSFAREKSEEKVPVQVREILADTLALAEAQMRKEGITLEVDIDDGVPMILGQPQQLGQVFLNIINNARDALNPKYPVKHEGKALKITVRRVTVKDCPHVRISFHDQGTGIPANIMNRIMNPFFSTKPKGKGTGLGLSISHGIIDNHGGKLTIHSVEGTFTEVMVDLPEEG